MTLAGALAPLTWSGAAARGATDAGGSRVAVGADVLLRDRFGALAGKRIALVTNQTGRVGDEHLVDVLVRSGGVRLVRILAPEHGFRGGVEAGAKVGDTKDPATGVPVLSLYGATRKPTPAMLAGIDAVVFDIQDVGVRFYTYISTMGLAMQAAAEAGVPFVVLDRPNPLGGDYVSGFVREPGLSSFVGQYPIPIVHGLTVGELAQMIRGERWLPNVEQCVLSVVRTEGWRRPMRWPETGLPWVPTSPNIPSFEAALVYPGMGLVGEADVNEGRGTPTPFNLFGAPWVAGALLARRLEILHLPGLAFRAERWTPRSIPGVALHPRYENQAIHGVRVTVTDAARVEPLEAGIHVLALLASEQRRAGRPTLFVNEGMLDREAGTRRLRHMLAAGRSAWFIIGSWREEMARFRAARERYLLYP